MSSLGRFKVAARVLAGRQVDPAQTPATGETPATTPDEQAILDRAAPYTMVPANRLLGNIDAVDYIVRRDLPGAIVECGVWRGGSMLVMVERLVQLGVRDRDVYLFDTFAGMTAPTEEDVSPFHEPAVKTWSEAPPDSMPWGNLLGDPELLSAEAVKKLIGSTGYPEEKVHLVKGPVEETIPAHAPAEIAVLRLDTDWYTSTAHELLHLYPLLTTSGVLIIDDYGHWEGARKAVDEYFAAAPPILLSRLDYAARMGVKN